MIKVRLDGDWEGAKRVMMRAPSRARKAIDRGLGLAGHYMVQQIVQGMRDLKPPLAASTTRTRRLKGGRGARGTKPLIKTGELRNSITVVRGTGEVFVGVPASSGKFRLAAIHENGATFMLRLTDKMRAFLFGVLFKNRTSSGRTGLLKFGIVFVRIPPRPFIGPVMDNVEHQHAALALFEKTVAKALGVTK